MHYLMEVVMPPTEDVEKALEEILKDYSEHEEENDHAFYDWYQIGGRFSGSKLEAKLGEDRIKAFYDKLKEEKVTVSSVVFGKEELRPDSQIEKVDNMWREAFPDSGVSQCPFFKHYEGNALDICTLEEMPKGHTCCRVIFAYKQDKALRISEMFQTKFYNGVSWLDAKWSGDFDEAMEMFKEEIKNYSDEYKEKETPKNDWLVVSVDYHT